jgi:hypothetical protein
LVLRSLFGLDFGLTFEVFTLSRFLRLFISSKCPLLAFRSSPEFSCPGVVVF